MEIRTLEADAKVYKRIVGNTEIHTKYIQAMKWIRTLISAFTITFFTLYREPRISTLENQLEVNNNNVRYILIEQTSVFCVFFFS